MKRILEREARIELAASSMAYLRSHPSELLPRVYGFLMGQVRFELTLRRLRGDCFRPLSY